MSTHLIFFFFFFCLHVVFQLDNMIQSCERILFLTLNQTRPANVLPLHLSRTHLWHNDGWQSVWCFLCFSLACSYSGQTLPVDGRAEAHADGQMDGVADEFLAGALSEEKQFKPRGRGAIWSSHQSSNVENSQILPLPFIIKPPHRGVS